MTDLFDRIKTLADSRGLSIPAVAQKAGLSSAVLYKWRSADSNPSTASLIAVATALGVSVDELKGKKEVDPHKEMATQVGALFRSAVDQQGLDAAHTADLKQEIEDILAIRARRLREKQDGKI